MIHTHPPLSHSRHDYTTSHQQRGLITAARAPVKIASPSPARRALASIHHHKQRKIHLLAPALARARFLLSTRRLFSIRRRRRRRGDSRK